MDSPDSSPAAHDGALGAAPGRDERVPTRLPLPLLIFSAALIGLLALLYLHEVAALAATNSQLQDLHAEQTRLERQDAEAHAQLGEVTSPAYVDQHARALGLAPAPLGSALVIAVNRAVLDAHPQSGGQP